MTREELIQELKEQIHNPICEVFIYRNENFNPETLISELPETIADFILSREKLLLEKIGKPLREGKEWSERFQFNPAVDHWKELYKAIDEALAIIEKEGGE